MLHVTCHIVGVCLEDVPAEMHGGFTVFPGSHRALEKWFQSGASATRPVEIRKTLSTDNLREDTGGLLRPTLEFYGGRSAQSTRDLSMR